MIKTKKMLSGLIRFIFGAIIGAMLFIPLTLIPIIGPLSTGFAAARISKSGPGRAATLGLISSCLGFAFWALFIFPRIGAMLDSTLLFIFFWVFAIWNITSILFTMIGAVLAGIGNMAVNIASTASQQKWRHTPEEFAEKEDEPGAEEQVFIVCPSCGSSNLEEAGKCSFCGAELRGKND